MHVNVRSVGVGRVGVCMLCVGNSEQRERGVKAWLFLFVYFESRKRELKIRPMNEGRCDERLKARVEESTCLTYTGLGCTTKQTRNT